MTPKDPSSSYFGRLRVLSENEADGKTDAEHGLFSKELLIRVRGTDLVVATDVLIKE